jgi:hypothetical protein
VEGGGRFLKFLSIHNNTPCGWRTPRPGVPTVIIFSIQNWAWIFHPDGNQSTIGTAYNQWLERANKRANNRPNFVNILAKSAFNKLIINVCERANKRANKIGYYWLL